MSAVASSDKQVREASGLPCAAASDSSSRFFRAYNKPRLTLGQFEVVDQLLLFGLEFACVAASCRAFQRVARTPPPP
eukprot:6192687-Pleurochrysis_carterae.AAC.1